MSVFFILAYRPHEEADWIPQFEQTFESGAEAQALAKSRNDYEGRWGSPARYRVRKVVDTDSDNFYAREAALNLTPVPWERSSYYQSHHKYQLAHIDPADKHKVRFYRSIEDAVEGKYTSLAVTRFLDRYEDMSEEGKGEILHKIGYYDGKVEFGITNDPDLIEAIYRNGPSSCMNDEDDYCVDMPNGQHPVRVYAEGDMALAYLKVGEQEHYTARAVVCPERKIYNSTYWHSTELRARLKDLGYVFAGEHQFEGCRIKALPDGDESYYMPYVDMAPYGRVSDCGKYIVMTHDATAYELRTTEGVAYYDPYFNDRDEDEEEDY